jgi:hypothetical protein
MTFWLREFTKQPCCNAVIVTISSKIKPRITRMLQVRKKLADFRRFASSGSVRMKLIHPKISSGVMFDILGASFPQTKIRQSASNA